jgi:hypothetical protein
MPENAGPPAVGGVLAGRGLTVARIISIVMTVAALVISIFGAVLAVVSLTWNIVSFLLQGARAKLTAVIGVRSDEGLVFGDQRDVSTYAFSRMLERFEGPLVVGVKVVNAGRSALHVTEWGIQTEDIAFGSRKFVPITNQMGATPPCDIAPGAEATFATDARHAAPDSLESGYGVFMKDQNRVLLLLRRRVLFRLRPFVDRVLLRTTILSGGRYYTSKRLNHSSLRGLADQRGATEEAPGATDEGT